MATQAQIDQLILIVGTELLTEVQMGEVIDNNDSNLIAAAAQVWEIRAGKYHGLVNITESGSSRNMGDLHKNALAMAQTYRNQLVSTEAIATSRTRTRRIVRE